jgi:hypothetical protein
VKRVRELGTTLMTEAICSYGTVVVIRPTRRTSLKAALLIVTAVKPQISYSINRLGTVAEA